MPALEFAQYGQIADWVERNAEALLAVGFSFENAARHAGLFLGFDVSRSNLETALRRRKTLPYLAVQWAENRRAMRFNLWSRPRTMRAARWDRLRDAIRGQERYTGLHHSTVARLILVEEGLRYHPLAVRESAQLQKLTLGNIAPWVEEPPEERRV